MKFATISASLALIAATSAAPIEARNNGGGGGGINDVAILQYALTLEHLEATFYAEALSSYSEADFTAAGFDASVRGRIQTIAADEASHVAFLSTALSGLGQTPTAACTYAFGYTDVSSFLATAAILEGVGVSAYLGAAASIMEKAYLTAAASIYGVEARHASYVRNTIGQSPFPSPYETPLGFNEVYTLAAGFITSCPSTNPALPVKAFPALAAAVQGDSVPGGMVKLTPADAKSIQGKGQLYAAFIGLTGTQFGIFNTETMTVTIPTDAAGQTYVVLTTASEGTPSDDNIVAGPAIFEVMPAASA